MSKSKKESFILCQLDKTTVLAATAKSYTIRERVKTKDGEYVWVSKYFYSEIGDAVRGYAKYALRRKKSKKKLDGSIGALISQIKKLEARVEKIGTMIDNTIRELERDPIENWLANKEQEK